jgi:hypothetical protein
VIGVVKAKAWPRSAGRRDIRRKAATTALLIINVNGKGFNMKEQLQQQLSLDGKWVENTPPRAGGSAKVKRGDSI